MGKFYIFIIILVLAGVGYGYYVYDKQKQELFRYKLEAINSKIMGIDTMNNELNTINPAIKLTLEDIQRQKNYLDTLTKQINKSKTHDIDIDSALQILKNL